MNLFRPRYRPGAAWAFFERHDIPDAYEPHKTYLRRYKVVVTPWFQVLVHNILLPDRDRHLHDHPWTFGTLILKGGYAEEYLHSNPGGLPLYVRSATRLWRRFSWHVVRKNEGERGEFHRIQRLTGDTWTLVLTGPRKGDWGFLTEDGWVEANEYFHRMEAAG